MGSWESKLEKSTSRNLFTSVDLYKLLISINTSRNVIFFYTCRKNIAQIISNSFFLIFEA